MENDKVVDDEELKKAKVKVDLLVKLVKELEVINNQLLNIDLLVTDMKNETKEVPQKFCYIRRSNTERYVTVPQPLLDEIINLIVAYLEKKKKQARNLLVEVSK